MCSPNKVKQRGCAQLSELFTKSCLHVSIEASFGHIVNCTIFVSGNVDFFNIVWKENDRSALNCIRYRRNGRVATAQGKQGIWFLLFPDRENTGNLVVTQGKFLRHKENIFDCIYYCKKHVSLYIFSIFFSLALLGICSTFT